MSKKKYIDADKLINELKALPEQERLEYMGVYDCIKSMTTADVAEVRRGEWIDVDDGSIHKSFGAYSGRCSECKKFSGIWSINEPYRFCPNCGAKMDGGGR